MAEEMNNQGCGGDCGSCGSSDCGSCGGGCDAGPESFLKPLNMFSSIKKTIAVVSGKGGVGKSFVTSSLAVELAKAGYKVGIMDADITGPSIPKVFGIKEPAQGDEQGIIPGRTKELGIEVMSVNMLLDDPSKPVIWRGPVIAGVVEQFWTDVMWGDLDYLLIDLLPGTGVVPLTVFQSIALDGIIIVTSPQDLVQLIVEKACNMAEMMNVPILGIVENYSYFECPDCGKKINIFGESKVDETANKFGVDVLGKLPIVSDMAELADAGLFEKIENKYIADAVNKIKL